MLKNNDIMIVGDSFCEHRTNESDWPLLVTQALTSQSDVPRGRGYPGCSWWSVRNNIYDEMKRGVPKILIICHTDPYRLPNDHDFGLNIVSVTNKDLIYVSPMKRPYYSQEVVKSAQSYYKHLFSEKYSVWAMNSWLQEIDNLAIINNILMIHLYSFDFEKYLPEMPKYKNQHGIIVKPALYDCVTSPHSSEVRNHMTVKENINFATQISDVIKNNINLKSCIEIHLNKFIT